MIKLFLPILAIFFSFIAVGQCGPLAAPYNQNNGQDGIMFDIVAITSVEVTNFDINCGGGPHDFEIYYRPGTHVGFENSAVGWNLIATANGVTGPVNVATPIPATFSSILCAGDVGAFYVTSTGAGSIDYTNGTGVGNVLAADANVQVLTGTGKDYPFAASYTPRSPNITVYYNCLSMTCCAVQNISVNPTICVAGAYSTSGSIDFMGAPATGTLIVSDCNGNQDIINAPFASPINYNITGQTADGAACTISAVFSDDASCTLIENYVAPAPCTTCSIDNLTANVSGCVAATNNYSVNGTVSFTDPPTTGTLVVEIDNGTTITDTIINLPFGLSQNWSISGMNSDGAACTVTAYFVDDPFCTFTINYTAPVACGCIGEVGTFAANIVGQSANNYVLCFGDQVNITSNGDNVNPYEALVPPGPAYDPGINWVIYSCPPTVALTPQLGTTVVDDPCFLGFLNTTDLNELNDMSMINSYPAGTFTNNTIYYVPVTMYGMSTGSLSHVANGLPCYETGYVYAVQYLEEFTYSVVEDCQLSTAEVTVNGALPAVDGSSFTAASLVPATANFVNSTALDGGIIEVGGLGDNDNYSFNISDANGCSYTINAGPFPVLENSGFSYSAGSYCMDIATTSANLTGTPGGTFSSTPGINLNPNTGEILISNSTPGSYDITYTTPDAICFTASTVNVVINALPIVDAGIDQSVCLADNVVLTAVGAQNYSWDNGVFNSTVFNPVQTLTYTVTGTDANGCQNTDQVDVNVFEYPTADFTFTPTITTTENTFIFFTNASNNEETYSWNFGDGNGFSTDENVDYLYPSIPDNYIITLVVTSNNGMCVDSVQKQLIVEDVVTFFIPNAFTPNNDEYNNKFQPVFTSGFDAYDFHFQIFNRWGEIVFESYDATGGWDGHYGDGGLVQDGVYTWQVDFKANLNDKRYVHRGHVTVLK